jgi:phosphate transport system substrate-binding protein
MKIATDGIALIVNNSNTDTLISVAQIKQVLGGELTTWQQLGRTAAGADSIKVVFDNANSSTLRFMLDSICGGELAGAHLFAQKSNPDVIDYVARTPGALGIIGVSWIGERSDSTLISFIDRVRVVSVSAEPVATASNSCKPYQAYIALGQYPLRRDIFALLNDPRGALPSSFYTFLSSDRGQRILLKAGIVPATQPLRIVNVNPL